MTADFSRKANSISADLQQQESDSRPQLPADCYVLPADDARPDARLFVIKDGAGNATHAELHFYDPLLTSTEQDRIKRLAQGILRKRYFGVAPDTPLQIFEAHPPVDTVPVTHTGAQAESFAAAQPVEITATSEPAFDLRWVIGGVVVLFLIVGLLFAALNMVMRRTGTVAAQQAATAVAAAAPVLTATPLAPAAAQQMETNNLPPSKNANPAIGIGKTVRIREGYQSYVRSAAGGDQGEPVGLLQNGGTAVVLGGPVWLQGDSDTIVWWYVQLPDGTRGWTPANTSQFTLLDPV